jgi:hypothetical protein
MRLGKQAYKYYSKKEIVKWKNYIEKLNKKLKEIKK